MGIGMLLVILYSFFYYRLLGSVIFAAAWCCPALLTFMALVVLGRQIGFTLTLAGHRRLHRLARCRGRLVRHLLRTAQGRDP